MKFDENGVLLADVPGSGVSRLDPDAKSGNPRHDTRSGKFGSGERAPSIPVPANVDPLEFARLRDAVRDAARDFEDFDEGDAKEFITARARDPSVVDLQQFVQMVRNQHLDDIVDILDAQMRKSGSLPTGRRKVRVLAPRGYVKRVIAGLSNEELAQVMHRLEGRGHDQADVDDFFDKRRRNNGDAKGMRNAIAASDQGWGQETLDGILTVELVENPNPSPETVIELAEKIATSIQPPVVNLEPQIIVEAPRQNKRVVRDERGFITGVEEIESAN